MAAIAKDTNIAPVANVEAMLTGGRLDSRGSALFWAVDRGPNASGYPS